MEGRSPREIFNYRTWGARMSSCGKGGVWKEGGMGGDIARGSP